MQIFRFSFLSILLVGCSSDGGGANNVGNGPGGSTSETQQVDLPFEHSFDIKQDQTSMVTLPYEVPEGIFDGAIGSVIVDMTSTINALTITPSNSSGKLRQLFQSGTSVVYYRIGLDEATACESEFRFGPFAITAEESGSISVEPETSTVDSGSVEILNTGTFVICAEITSGASASIGMDRLSIEYGTQEDDSNGDPDPGDPSGCNLACGFDDNAPEGQRAAGVCDISVPNDGVFQGSPTDGEFCESDVDCDDADACTTNTCIGAVVKICESSEVTDCSQAGLSIVNGDELVVTFDRVVVSATVNGMQTTIESKMATWFVDGLSPGEQTLLLEWENRAGADPATGCHEVDVVVR